MINQFKLMKLWIVLKQGPGILGELSHFVGPYMTIQGRTGPYKHPWGPRGPYSSMPMPVANANASKHKYREGGRIWSLSIFISILVGTVYMVPKWYTVLQTTKWSNSPRILRPLKQKKFIRWSSKLICYPDSLKFAIEFLLFSGRKRWELEHRKRW